MSIVTIKPHPRQPDIAYQPDYDAYRRRTQKRLENETLSKELPPGFPAKLSSPIVWKGSDFKNEDEWTLVLSAHDFAEIEQGIAHFKGSLFFQHTHGTLAALQLVHIQFIKAVLIKKQHWNCQSDMYARIRSLCRPWGRS